MREVRLSEEYNGRVNARGLPRPLDPGDVARVPDGLAAYLVDERAGFEYADARGDGPPDTTPASEAADADAGDDSGRADSDDSDADPDDVCTTVKSDGDVCGRDRPCPYHDD